MATIRPSIYIGLGGTGILAISKTKKMYEDAYGKGNIPEQIAFAAIDFDLTMENDKNLATEMKEDFISLKNMSSSPKQLYNVGSQQGDYTWMFPANTRFIQDRISDGASQVRTYGRFLTEMIYASIDGRIADCITQVKNIQNSFEHDEERNQPIDVHIVMSLAGGTGAGSFINVAHLIRDKYNNQVNLIGYGVLHGVFRTMDPSTNKSPRVVANAYSSILDLDFLMEASPENPVKVTFMDTTKELKQPLYDEFYVIDNETENGKRVDNIKKLCEVLGTCLYVAGGEMGSKIKSGQSNTGWKNGNFDITPKLGWVQSLGACQVVYKGDLLADIYGFKAALEIIRKLRQYNADIQQKAIEWTEYVKIREDGGDAHNDMIDKIYNSQKFSTLKLPKLDIKDSINTTEDAINKYIDSLVDFPDEEDIQKMSEEIIIELNKKVTSLININNKQRNDDNESQGGVGNSLIFLDSLISLLGKFESEMISEIPVYDKKQKETRDAIKNRSLKEYEDYTKKMFSTRKGKEELLENIARKAKEAHKDKIEAERRKVASDIFKRILTEVESLKERVKKIDDKLSILYKDYQSELTLRQNTSESSLVFEYDLSYYDRLNMNFDSTEVSVNDYIDSLNNKSLLDVDPSNDLDSSIKTFVASLKRTNEYRNKLIVDVIKDLNEDQYKNLKKEISEKSSRLLRLEDRGQKNRTRNNALATSMLVQNYLISLYNKKDDAGNPLKSRIEDDHYFLKDIKKEFVSSNFDSMKQKIIFYRSDMAIIPYCIGSFDDMTVEREYNSLILDAGQARTTSFNPHFDRQMFTEMRLKDFKLKPEMQNEAILYWVCGHIFGWQPIKEIMYLMQKDINGIPQKIEGKEETEHHV